MKMTLILAAMLALAGCGPTAPKTDPKADKDAVNKLRDDFIAAFNANDAAKVGALYSENATQLPGNQPTVQGRSAIVEHNKALFDQVKAKINITPHTTTVSGDLAVDEGTYTMEATPKASGSKPIHDEGRYIVVLQREADGWKVIEDIDNNSKPATPPAAAPAKAPAKAAVKPKAAAKKKR